MARKKKPTKKWAVETLANWDTLNTRIRLLSMEELTFLLEFEESVKRRGSFIKRLLRRYHMLLTQKSYIEHGVEDFK